MLVPGSRASFLWSLNPIPMPFTMSSQSPTVIQWLIIIGPSTKYNNHAAGTSCSAKSSRVVNSWTRSFSLASYFRPCQWFLLYIEYPAIVDSAISNITSKHNQKWFAICEGMSISLAWGPIVAADSIPNSYSLFNIQMKQFIRCQSSRSSCSSVYHNFIWLDANSTMGCSGRRRNSSCYVIIIFYFLLSSILLLSGPTCMYYQ